MTQLKMYSADRKLDFLMEGLGLRSLQGLRQLYFIFITSNLLAFTLTEIVTRLFFSFFLTQDIADSKILSLTLVTLPTEKENWIVAGTQSGSLWAVNTEDETRRHRLQKMSDSITCLYCNSLSKQRYK